MTVSAIEKAADITGPVVLTGDEAADSIGCDRFSGRIKQDVLEEQPKARAFHLTGGSIDEQSEPVVLDAGGEPRHTLNQFVKLEVLGGHRMTVDRERRLATIVAVLQNVSIGRGNRSRTSLDDRHERIVEEFGSYLRSTFVDSRDSNPYGWIHG